MPRCACWLCRPGRAIAYYAPSEAITLPKNTSSPDLIRVVERRRPHIVLIHCRRLPATVYKDLLTRQREFGLVEIDCARVAPGDEGLLMLALRENLAAAPSLPHSAGKTVATLPGERR